MNFSNIRGLAYVVALLAGLGAAWAASKGLGTYDPDTRMFDPAAFNVDAVVATVISAAGNLLAGVAWFKGWARK